MYVTLYLYDLKNVKYAMSLKYTLNSWQLEITPKPSVCTQLIQKEYRHTASMSCTPKCYLHHRSSNAFMKLQL